MTITTVLITFATGVLQRFVTAHGTMVARLQAEPLNANTGRSYVGTSSLTKSSGVGVIAELAAPNAVVTSLKDRFLIADEWSANTIDASDYWGDGTNGEKLLVTYWTK